MPEIRCPKCGSQTVIVTTKEDDRRYYVCVNRPGCTGRIAVDQALGYIWGEERPVSIGAGGTWQQTEQAPPSRAGTAVRRLEEGKLLFKLLFKRSKGKKKAPVSKVKGDDKSRKIQRPKRPSYLPRHAKVREKQASYEAKEISKHPSQVVPMAADGEPQQRIKQAPFGREYEWGDDWGDEIPAPKPAAHRPRLWKIKIPQAVSREPEHFKIQKITHHKPEQPGVLEKETTIEGKEPLQTRPNASTEKEIIPEKKAETYKEKKPARHWWRRVSREETSPEAKEPPEIQQKGESIDEVPLKKEEPPSPEWLRAPMGEVPLKKEEPAMPELQVASEREVAPRADEPVIPTPQITQQPERVAEVQKPHDTRSRLQATPEEAVSSRSKKPSRHWRQRAPGKKVATRDKELSKPRPQVASKKEAATGKKELPRPRPQVASKKEAATGGKELPRPRPQIAPRKEAAAIGKELSRPRPQVVPEKGAASEGRETPRPVRQVTRAPLAIHEIKESTRPVKPVAPKFHRPDRVRKSLQPRPVRVARSDFDARRKKYALIIIITVVVSMAMDAMVLAAFVLR